MFVSPFHSGYQTGTLANSENPDEMPHAAAFHQGIFILFALTEKSLENEIQ